MAPSNARWLICFLLVFTAGNLFAQASSFHIERQTRFIQRLSWVPDEYALRYEVEIQRETGGYYQRHLFESTEEPSIHVSLPPGNYRYRVTPYNLLNRPGRISEWLEFEIIPALNPTLSGFSPEYFSLTSSDNEFILHLYGDNLISQDEMYLLHLNGSVIVPTEIQILHDNKEAHLRFSREQLTAGVYQVYVRNPGGLDASISGFIIYNEIAAFDSTPIPSVPVSTSPDTIYVYVGVSWFTLLDLHGENTQSDNFLSGAAFRINVVSSNLNFFNIGLEVVPAWFSLDDLGSEDALDSEVQSLLLELNFLLQKQFLDQKLALTFRAGAGMILPSNAQEEPQNPLNKSLVYVNTGLSFLGMPLKFLFIEAGVNYSFLIDVDNYSSHLRPWLSVGFRF
jgi:hypothetical protein